MKVKQSTYIIIFNQLKFRGGTKGQPKEINHLIKVIQDGNERLQCIAFLDNNYKPLLIASAYLPNKGCHDMEEFKENVDQLFEICQKYCLNT
jgi:hypothetical protein